MKRWYAFVMMVVMLAPILFTPACVPKAAYEEPQGELQRMKEEVVWLKSVVANLDSLLSDTREELASTKAKLEAAEEKLNLYKETLRIDVLSGVQPPYSKTGFLPFPSETEKWVRLINNKDATDPTWQQLKAFLFADKTDQAQFLPGFCVCGGFAEKVHNNAEAAGIRAAWVAVEFEEGGMGHALNAFNTVDKGLVFVDCVGFLSFPEVELPRCDKIAYVVAGKECGLVGLNVAVSPEYSFYETYQTKAEEYFSKLEVYNQEVDAYNQALGGRAYLEEPKDSRFKTWNNRLDSMATELDELLEELGGFYWEPLGMVSKIEIYW